ncbi:cysteine hydrolase [Mycoplana sp. MJR14]|uniref:cysteine hydrolase n=1 Tax=Mycoplana sp. MJR14 TaxID=3032583 RepID=UPI0023DA1A92|nr:cysteine hydrolase [Mycoplana sp. MJR14]MDF1631798.1 cysteine hydrolase [Mycoplana sp. MJR14]
MCSDCDSGRRTFLATLAGAGALGALAGASTSSAEAAGLDAYADPANPALPPTNMQLNLARTALVVIDPQVDFMSPASPAWPVVGESVTELNTVPNLVRLFKAAKSAGIPVVISPHYYYPHDHHWKVEGPLEILQHRLGMFDRKGPLTLDGFAGSGAEWMPEFKEYIEDGKTIVCSPHKLYGPQANDLVLQLGKQGVNHIILTGMAANLCVESHLRHLLEQGFEVAVVRDAIAAAKFPEGDGYLAALINFRFIANGLWTTDETLKKLSAA